MRGAAQEITPFLRVLGCYPMDLDAGDAVTSREAIVASDAELLGNQAQELLRTGSWSSARTPAEVCAPLCGSCTGLHVAAACL